MARRYLTDPLPTPGSSRLPDDVAHHVGSVLRLRPGDGIVLFDGRGNQCAAELTAVRRAQVDVQIGPTVTVPPPPRRLHLAFAPPRWQRAEWLFEHGTELGVMVFHPLWTERTRPQGERADRWRKLTVAAAGQCDRAWLPEVTELRSLAEFLVDPTLPAIRFVGVGGAARPDPRGAPECVLLVGPEGGLTPAELAAAQSAGFVPCGLGPHVLRTETAALVGAALLLV
ncbi:MAG: 16S rRNA (uracil(1498)-N(3))-methyltransferase [Planctomycetes bacterium]|nr:16S rRNA (uracil(1498)-N(3))-methyltransferase [Planctomycetota bacterium]